MDSYEERDYQLEKANDILFDITQNSNRLLGFIVNGCIKESDNWKKGRYMIKLYLSIMGITGERKFVYYITEEQLLNFENEKEDWIDIFYWDLKEEKERFEENED